MCLLSSFYILQLIPNCVCVCLCVCRGEGSSVFCRAGLSADGRIVVCGTTSRYLMTVRTVRTSSEEWEGWYGGLLPPHLFLFSYTLPFPIPLSLLTLFISLYFFRPLILISRNIFLINFHNYFCLSHLFPSFFCFLVSTSPLPLLSFLLSELYLYVPDTHIMFLILSIT